MPVRLTEEVLRNAPAPERGSVTIWDDPDLGPARKKGVRGFGVRIHAGRTRSFFLNYRRDGVERRHTIGEWPEFSVEAAREEARNLRDRVRAGDDPAQERRERREAPTMRELLKRYLDDHLPTKTAEGTVQARRAPDADACRRQAWRANKGH